MSEISPREQAIKAIKEGNMVVVNDVVYKMENLQDLPPLEDFVRGDAEGEQKAFESMLKEKKELEERLADFEAEKKTKASKAEESKAEEEPTEKKGK